MFRLQTVPGNIPVKFDVRSFNRFGAIGIYAQKFRGSRDPSHAHLGDLLCIHFVVLFRHTLCLKFECSRN